MGEAVGERAQFLHQAGDAIEHRIDLDRQPVEDVAGAGDRDAMAEIAAGVALGDGDDPPHPFAEIARHQPARQQPDQHRDHRRQQQGALEDVLEDQLVVEAAPVQHPAAVRQFLQHEAGGDRPVGAAPLHAAGQIAGLGPAQRVGDVDVAGGMASAAVDHRAEEARIARRCRHRALDRDVAADRIDVGEHAGFVGDLLAQRLGGIVDHPVIDEADQDEVGDDRQQRRQQRYPERQRQPHRGQAAAESL